jgi:hypothetical protein
MPGRITAVVALTKVVISIIAILAGLFEETLILLITLAGL